MFSQGLSVEVNLSSNKYLLQIDYKEHPLKTFIELGWPVVLGTDDPSVWPESELRNEFEIAIRYEHIHARSQLRQLVLNSMKYSFLESERRKQLEAELEEELTRLRLS